MNAAVRPMLAGGDPLERIRQLLSERAAAYDLAHYSIPTDDQTPEQVADEILRIYRTESRQTESPTPTDAGRPTQLTIQENLDGSN